MATEYKIQDAVAGAAIASQRQWNPPEELLALGEQLVLKLVLIFKSNTGQSLLNLADLLSKSDFRGVKLQAHSIKGCASQMGAAEVSSLCAEIEAAADAASASHIRARLPRLEAEYSRICKAMDMFAGAAGAMS